MIGFVHLRTADKDHPLYVRADVIVSLERLDEARTRVYLDRRMMLSIGHIDVLESVFSIERDCEAAQLKGEYLERARQLQDRDAK